MNDFLDRLNRGITACGLPGKRVLLAVSGGPDSVAMLRGLHALAAEHGLSLHAAHLNHQLRGPDSRADAAWLQALCDSLAIPLIVQTEDVAKVARITGRGTEETARAVRYEFLKAMALGKGCAKVAVAHTADDQAETILHHIVRGTGFEGLRGMARVRRLDDECEESHGAQPVGLETMLVRPLLEIRRADVEAYLTALGQDARTDATNRDEKYTRNRIRLSLLPMLERDFNPKVRDALLKLSRQADDLQELVQSLAAELLARAIEDKNPAVARLNCEALVNSPRHLIRECFSLLWRELGWPRQKMGFDEWDRLAELMLSNEGSAMLPGPISATRRGTLLVLRKVSST
ncbi:MAG: tRNA lysidine(34) synthetase TilS [Planctomycetaceae bacterium]